MVDPIRLQMFIGEMGCWLVVWGISLWNRYRRRSRSRTSPPESSLRGGAYQPINAAPNDRLSYDGTVTSTGDATAEPDDIAKPLTEVEEDDDDDGDGSDSRPKLKGLKVVLLAAPACCDITGTTLMNVGLLFVAASIYQMTRGALVLFVGLFSVLFLRRKLYLYQWLSLLCVVIGVGLVGLAGAIFKDHQEVEASSPSSLVELTSRAAGGAIHTAAKAVDPVQVVIGVMFIAGAQVFTASQFVLEEWILENYAMAPLRVVGWEGIFGALVTTIGMAVLHLAIGSTEAGRYGYFDAAEGWRNMTTVRSVAVSSILIMISIG